MTLPGSHVTAAKRQIVVLVKVDGTIGRLRIGTRDTTKHPADLSRDEAIARAFRGLQRTNSDENPGCWEAQDEEPEA